MRVFVTGLTGFIGQAVGRALLDAGHEVVALVRMGHEARLGELEGRVTIANGDVTQRRTLEAGMAGCDAAVNLVGIIREQRGLTFEKVHWDGAVNMVEAAKAQGVSRFIQMSANGAKPTGTRYQTTKHRAEEYVKASGLDWTIFRPSVVFGDPEGRMNFVTELAEPLKFAPVFPIFGEGDFLLQPVHKDDLALAIARSLTAPATFEKTYCVGGPRTYTYREVVETIAAAWGRTVPLVSVPLPLVRLGVGMGEWLPGFPITQDQLTMLVEGNACPGMEWAEVLGIEARPFNAEALRFLVSKPPAPAGVGR